MIFHYIFKKYCFETDFTSSMPVKYDLPKRITKSQPERFTYQGRRRIHILRVRWSGSPQGIFLRSRSFDTTPPEKESCNIPIASIGFRPGEKARREREGVQDPTQSPQTPSFLGEESVFSNYKTFSLPDPRETKIILTDRSLSFYLSVLI